ncbi:HGGxSTG domain-containing protein [Aquitalea pelogenes]|uniref:HGGxSTG domain-containing protein n=1 Tax=Aquitalea pelogenes TaxID=1293573 RepID=UPI0035AEF466
MDSLTCGAKTRAGTPCKITAIYGSGRCKLHGGLSTGPTTPEGKAKAAKNGQKRGEPHERYGKVGFPRE